MVHVFPHWNWKPGETVKVWSYSNCDEVELFLNGKSQGRKKVIRDSHAEWNVIFSPGKLVAQGFINGKKVAIDAVQTTGKLTSIQLQSHKPIIDADNEDLAIISVSALDTQKSFVANANDQILFSVEGPGRIIGVGNGDPSSTEPDTYTDSVVVLNITHWKTKAIDSKENLRAILANDDFVSPTDESIEDSKKPLRAFLGTFDVNKKFRQFSTTFFLKQSATKADIYLNGKLLRADTTRQRELAVPSSSLSEGKNVLTLVIKNSDNNNVMENDLVSIQLKRRAEQWKRKLFNGLSQVIIQSTGEPGQIVLKATSGNSRGEIKITCK
jgi:beta-galactosidase